MAIPKEQGIFRNVALHSADGNFVGGTLFCCHCCATKGIHLGRDAKSKL